MSYCRLGDDSDVYVLAATDDRFWCVACPMRQDTWTCRTRGKLIEHLRAHRRAGHRVPDRVFGRLRREMEEL